MVENGYIKLHRSLLKWEWIDVPGMLTVFVLCLLMANWKDERYHGEVIERGSFVTSIQKFAKICGYSEPYVRKCLKKLNESGEIELKSSNKGTRVKVLNYALYQDFDEHTVSNRVSNTVSDRVSNGVSNRVSTNEEYKEYKEDEEVKNNTRVRARYNSFGEFWNRYPKHTRKAEAEQAFQYAIDTGTNPDDILQGLGPWLEYFEGLESDQFVKNPYFWILEECWKKDPPKNRKQKPKLPEWYNPDPNREPKEQEPMKEDEMEQFRNLMKLMGEHAANE